MIQYKCSHCGTKLESPPGMAGQEDRCPACGHLCVVPQPKVQKEKEVVRDRRGAWTSRVAPGLRGRIILIGLGAVAVLVLGIVLNMSLVGGKGQKPPPAPVKESPPVVVAQAPAVGAFFRWRSGSGDWATPGKWDANSVPSGDLDYAFICSGSQAAPTAVTVSRSGKAACLGIGCGLVPKDPNAPNAPVETGSYNTVTVTGKSTTLEVQGSVYIAYKADGDYNRLIVEDGATVTADGLTQAFQWDVKPQNLHNELIVRSGGALNLRGEKTRDSFISTGSVTVDGGTINAVTKDSSFRTRGWAFESTGDLVYRGGLLNLYSFDAGYNSGAVRIGDGAGEPMRLHLAGGESSFWGGYTSVATPRNPNNPTGPRYPRGISLVIKSDGILSGSASALNSTESGSETGYLIEGGRVTPGAMDNSSPGEFRITSGWLGFDLTSTLEIDLFAADSFDRITLAPADAAKPCALYVANGAKMAVALRGGYVPQSGQSWDVLKWTPGSLNKGALTDTKIIHSDRGLGQFRVVNNTGGSNLQFTLEMDDARGVGTLSVGVTATPPASQPATDPAKDAAK